MLLKTFKGGVHPYEGKELSKDRPIEVYMPKGELVFPMAQHIGAPAKPLVKVGDEVLVGQKIGEAVGFISANVICSVSGKVKKIEPRKNNKGAMVESVIVENDGNYSTIEGFGQDRDASKLSKEEIRSIIKEAGIVGLGGAGFPTHVKLTPKDDEKIEYILVNAAECEPYLTSDYRLMLEEPEKIIGGLKIILSLFPNAKGIIGVEDNKPDAIKILSELAQKEEKISVQSLISKYPQGGERSLIKVLTDREVNSSMLPADAGCVVDNVDTVISIYMAVAKSTPLIRKIITVTGDAVVKPQNYNVRLGTIYAELLEASGGFSVEPQKIVCGGPMMGDALADVNLPVVKNSSALTAFKVDAVSSNPETPCIKCSRCVGVCPSILVPQLMMEAVKTNNKERFVQLNGMECIECGACAFICPAKIPLTQGFKFLKQAVMADRRKKAAEQQAKGGAK